MRHLAEKLLASLIRVSLSIMPLWRSGLAKVTSLIKSFIAKFTISHAGQNDCTHSKRLACFNFIFIGLICRRFGNLKRNVPNAPPVADLQDLVIWNILSSFFQKINDAAFLLLVSC